MSKHAIVDVFLRGNRTYVQGTQIVTTAAKFLGDAEAVLTECKFAHISQNLVSFTLDPSQEAIGSVAFKNAADEKKVVYILDQGTPAPTRDIPMHIEVTSYEATNDHAKAHCKLRCQDNFESVLNALVQAVKLHQSKAYGDISNNWFTGLRRASLPVKLISNMPQDKPDMLKLVSVDVDVELVRRFSANDINNAMYKISLRRSDDTRKTLLTDGFITFSYS